jgi:hypothetical protein
MPLFPPPPIWAARRLHAAGSTTRKLISFAVLLVSTGVIDPSIRQCAGTPPAASTHDEDDNVTARTGSPILDGSIDGPTLVAVQSAAVNTTSGPSRRSVEPGGAWASATGTPTCQTIAATNT